MGRGALGGETFLVEAVARLLEGVGEVEGLGELGVEERARAEARLHHQQPRRALRVAGSRERPRGSPRRRSRRAATRSGRRALPQRVERSGAERASRRVGRGGGGREGGGGGARAGGRRRRGASRMAARRRRPVVWRWVPPV